MPAAGGLTETTKTVRGHILLVQEGRFRLLTDDGRGLLLTLAHDANVESWDLQRLHGDRARVEISYTGEPNFASGAVHEVRRL